MVMSTDFTKVGSRCRKVCEVVDVNPMNLVDKAIRGGGNAAARHKA
jgi:hypothetical protein